MFFGCIELTPSRELSARNGYDRAGQSSGKPRSRTALDFQAFSHADLDKGAAEGWLPDQPYIPSRLAAAPTPSQPAPVLHWQADDISALHCKMVFWRLSFAACHLRLALRLPRKTSSPGYFPQVSYRRSERSRPTSPRADDSMEVIIELKQINDDAQLMHQP